jgi:hypothetical protein
VSMCSAATCWYGRHAPSACCVASAPTSNTHTGSGLVWTCCHQPDYSKHTRCSEHVPHAYTPSLMRCRRSRSSCFSARANACYHDNPTLSHCWVGCWNGRSPCRPLN